MVSHNQVIDLHPVDFEFSADRSYLLIKTLSQRVWRRSSFGSYALVKMGGDGRPAPGPPVPLLPQGVEAGGDDLHQYLRFVSWAPVGNALAYVDYENNLHYRPAAEAADIQLTSSGVESVVYNGIPDWVNEEEVFEDNRALYWSPDGQRLVYGVFNDTAVEVVRLPRYGNWREDTLNRQGYPFLQYFLFDDFRYPKAGAVNPSVTVWCAEVGPPGPSADRPVRQYILPPPRSLATTEYHFTLVTWASNTTVAVNWMNRVQNLTAINLCEVGSENTAGKDPECNEVFVMEQRDGWVDYLFKVVFNRYKFTKRFLTIMPAATMRHRYRQLFLVDLENNSRTLLTRAEAEVTEILLWTQDDMVYYVATSENKPGSRHLYRLELGQPEPTCLTCLHHAVAGGVMTPTGGGNTHPVLPDRAACDFVSVTMSPGGSYYSMDCKGPDVPYSCVHHTATNTLASVWTDNRFLAARYSLLDAPTVRYLSVPVPGSDQEAQVVVFLPSAAAASGGRSSKKFPLLVDVYGGPGFQKVDQQWGGWSYGTYLASAQGVIYAMIDPRGSGFQGDAWQHAIYRNFGTLEVTDTLHVTERLQHDHLAGLVDEQRTAIWGWSYGGFLSLSALTQDMTGVFACGASVAPVVRWELYDTLYTERYMSTPADNPAGYNASTPLWGLGRLKGKKYLVIHGTHDDNVHYQQSMLLAAALEEKDVLFRQQSYPDQDHGIGDYRRHLYHTLTQFLMEDCFKKA